MSGTEWHVEEAVWRAYVAGGLDTVAEASVDAHVIRCARCQGAARTYAPASTLESVWSEVSAEIARPELPRTVRWLRRLGVPEDDLVTLAAADGFLVPWALAVGCALACVAVAAMAPAWDDVVFVLTAPLIPVLAVVAAFDATDPLRALAVTTPYSKLRLALLRTAATLVVALPATMAIGLIIPGLRPFAFSWLLPALALTFATLALLTWMRPWTASGFVAAAWTTVVLTASGSTEVALLTGESAQMAYAAALVLSSTAWVLRTSTVRLAGGNG